MSTNPYQPPQVSSVRPALRASDYTFKDASGLARVVFFFLAISLVGDIAAAISDYMEASLLGGEFTLAEAESNDSRQAIIAIVGLIILLPTGILFLVWVHRVNSNAHALGFAEMEYTPGWSVGWYFIPIANLWKPFQVMREIWESSAPDDSSEEDGRTSPVGLWWTAWIGAGILGQVSGRLSLQAEQIESLQVAAYLSLITNVVSVLTCLMAMWLVNAVTAKQTRGLNAAAGHSANMPSRSFYGSSGSSGPTSQWGD